MLRPWEKIDETEIRAKNPWWEYRFERVKLPNGKEGEYHYMHTPIGVSVIPRMADGKFFLVRQYRHLFGRESLEFCGGGGEEDVPPEETARRECEEETGMAPRTLRFIGKGAPYLGACDETLYIFLAEDLQEKGKGRRLPDESEDFEFAFLTAKEIEEAIVDGRIFNLETIAAWHMVKQFLFNEEI